MYKSYTVDEAKKKLEYYCSYQERCHEEVVEKLKSLNMIPQAADMIIIHLIENNYLNEERFACSFARGKHRMKQWGKKRIVAELKFRKITKFNIDKALKEISEEEYSETFDKAAQKAWDSLIVKNIYVKKRKVADYLLRKGYESDIVYQKISLLANREKL